jgi:hypothetical protein
LNWLIIAVITCDLINLGCAAQPPLIARSNNTIEGHATTYAPGMMAQVSHNRGLPIVECMVASPFHEIGDWIYVKSNKTGAILKCRVTDISMPKDQARHQRNRLFEFDFTSWKKLCGTHRIDEQPWRQCKIEVSDG